MPASGPGTRGAAVSLSRHCQSVSVSRYLHVKSRGQPAAAIERWGYGAWVLVVYVTLIDFVLFLIHFLIGPFLTAVPDEGCAPSDGITLPALHKLRTQVCFSLFHRSAIRFGSVPK